MKDSGSTKANFAHAITIVRVGVMFVFFTSGFSTYDRNYDRAVENVLRDLREISVQPDQTDEQPDNEDHNLDVTGKDDADKEDHDKEDEGDKEDDYNKEDEGDKDDQHKEDHDDYDTLDHECFDFKALVLNHLIGFPNVRHMSRKWFLFSFFTVGLCTCYGF